MFILMSNAIMNHVLNMIRYLLPWLWLCNIRDKTVKFKSPNSNQRRKGKSHATRSMNQSDDSNLLSETLTCIFCDVQSMSAIYQICIAFRGMIT